MFLSLFPSCREDGSWETEDRVSSRSYRGHEVDVDADNLVAAYPSILGTRLDDCHTCHAGKTDDGKPTGNACDTCHELLLHDSGHTGRDTLNAFGLAYLDAGRSREALRRIKDDDSDGDGFSNDEELLAGRYPGGEGSMPGQTMAPILMVTLEELKAMQPHSQLMLSNTTQQQLDEYVTYKGVKIKDLLEARNVDLAGATGITVIAPDGYVKTLPIVFVNRVFPQPLFYSGLDMKTLGSDCGVVRYPEDLPEGLSDGSPISGEHRLMIGYERNGVALEPCYLDVTEGRIRGEGPLRIVVPQERPGRPDRGSRFSPTQCGDGLDFREGADHNAGSMVRGVIAIRIDPVPAGVEEFDYRSGGWAYVDAGQLILYGHNVR